MVWVQDPLEAAEARGVQGEPSIPVPTATVDSVPPSALGSALCAADETPREPELKLGLTSAVVGADVALRSTNDALSQQKRSTG